MLLTFLTRQNALEFGISGIASIFIGIGVNNFTAIEMEQQDERSQHLKSQREIKTLVHLQEKIKKIEKLHGDDDRIIRVELEEMKDYIELCLQFMEEV